MNTSKLNAALDAAARGFRVFPLRRDTKLPWREGWQQAATTDKATITEWWQENPNYNIGIATGNGTLVVDVDIKNGKQGASSLEILELMGLPESLTVKTASGGKHIYFKIPDHIAGRVDNIEGFPGIDTRGDGNLAVWPGSNIGRNKYELTADIPTAECPDWFRTILANVPKQVQRQDDIAAQPDQPKNIEKAIHWLQTTAPSAIEGDAGDKTTFAVAAELRAFGISEETAFELMADHWNEDKASPPWSPDHLKTKIANAYNYGQGAFGGKTAEGEFGVLDIDIGEPPSIEKRTSVSPTPEKPAVLNIVKASEFDGKEKPVREWHVKELIPAANVTILNGDGATGKSLLSLQLAIATATGDRWIGTTPKQGPVLYYSAEDDESETHIRVCEICDSEGITLPELNDLHIAIMAGQDALLVTESANANIMQRTELFKKLDEALSKIKPALLVLDNLADVFGGNENAKAPVRQFISMLRGLAIKYHCAVVLLAHPSLNGMNSGTGSSGNVAWNNSVRSRLYLTRVKNDDGIETDRNARVLRNMKVNYAGGGNEIPLHWERGRFVSDEIDELDDLESEEPASQMDKAKRAFLRCLAQFDRENRIVSPSRGANYAPIVFAKHTMAGGNSKMLLEAAMNELLLDGKIRVEEHGYASRPQKKIVLVEGNDHD